MPVYIVIVFIVIGFLIGFVVSDILSGSKFKEFDTEIRNQKIINNRKDQIIDFYKANNSNTTNITKERKK